MAITAAQAQAELDRRAKAQAPRITAGQAQAELERRRSAGAANEPGILQQLFDVKNSETGKSYLYDNTPAPATYEDLQRTVADTVSRGYLDKLRRPEAQARTAAARERMPDWVELPTDIGVAVASSPYRIGSMGVGAVAGGLEGAASAYGHQKDWIPDEQGALDIFKGAGIGTVAGAGGAKLGEWLGKGFASKAAEEARPYQSNEALTDAAGLAQREALDAERKGFTDLTDQLGTQADDLAERVALTAKVRGAQGSTRDDLAKMLAGMDEASPELQAKLAESAQKPLRTKAGELVDQLPGKELNIPMLAVETVLGHGIPWKTLGGMLIKSRVSKAGKSANVVSDKEIEAAANLARNGPLQLDPAIIDKWREAFAKTAIGTARRP